MSFQQVFELGHLDHLLATCPQREDIWAIWAMCQAATTHCRLSFVNCPLICTYNRTRSLPPIANVATDTESLPPLPPCQQLRPPPTATNHESPPPPPPSPPTSRPPIRPTNLAKPPRELA